MATLTQVRNNRFLEAVPARGCWRLRPRGLPTGSPPDSPPPPHAPAIASAHGSVLLDVDGDGTPATAASLSRSARPGGPEHTNARRQVTASGASVRATFAGLAPPGIAGPFPLLGIYLWPRRMAAPNHHRPFPSRGRLVVLVAVVLLA